MGADNNTPRGGFGFGRAAPEPDAARGAAARKEAAPYTVSRLNAEVRRALRDQFGAVRVIGEISGLKRAASGLSLIHI